jgi:hypothetical protein
MSDGSATRVADALRPTARAVPRVFYAVALVAVAPVFIGRVRDVHDYATTLLLSALLIGAASGFAVDDAAARTFESVPTVLRTRRILRFAVVATVLSVAVLVVAVLAVSGNGMMPRVGDVIPFGVAAAALALGFASLCPPDAPSSPGLVGTAGAVLSVITVAALSLRLRFLPSLSPRDANRWFYVAAGALAVAWWQARDPAARSLTRRRRGA